MSVAAEYAIKMLRKILLKEPRVNILRQRSSGQAAVNRFKEFAQSLTILNDEEITLDAAYWRIVWCANASVIMVGPTPPVGHTLQIKGGDTNHSYVILLANQLANKTEEYVAYLAGTSPSYVILNDVGRAMMLINIIEPIIEIYKICCIVYTPKAQNKLLQIASSPKATMGGQADCLMMVAPILLPNLCSSICFLANELSQLNIMS